MRILEENDLSFDFTAATKALKFDQNDPEHDEYHDLCNMPRVDFIIEADDSVYFIEIKDTDLPNPSDPGAQKFLKKVAEGTLEASLVEKYIFTFLFRWAEECLDKSVHFISLITLESPLLQPIIAGMDANLYSHFKKSSKRWTKAPLHSCQVHNIETWEACFPQWPITRISSQTPTP